MQRWRETRYAVLGALVFLAGCSQRHARVTRTGRLPAPALVAPRDQEVFSNYPRTVGFAWSGVPQAAGYGIEIDCYGCCAQDRWCSDAQGMGYIVPKLTAIAYTFTFWADKKGRWRVWAVDARSRPGIKSEWSGFAFRAVPQETDGTDAKKPSPFGMAGPKGH